MLQLTLINWFYCRRKICPTCSIMWFNYCTVHMCHHRPEQRFEDYIPVEEKDSLEPKKQILKRSKDLVATVGSSQKVRTGLLEWCLVDSLFSWSSSHLVLPMLIWRVLRKSKKLMIEQRPEYSTRRCVTVFVTKHKETRLAFIKYTHSYFYSYLPFCIIMILKICKLRMHLCLSGEIASE